MTLPRISIVTPSYNQASYINWTVRSVLLQRYPELEYIVMDGGSNDGTQKVLEPYAKYFTHYVSERDKGQSDAISRGFEHATGDIMAYLNSDDMLAPGALHYVAEYFDRHPDVDAIYSHRCLLTERNIVTWYWILPPHSDYLMMRWDLIPQETCFWRRRLFEKAGNINPTYRFALDYDLFVRYMQAGRFVRVKRFLGAFRQHADAKTTQLMATIGTDEVQRVWRTYGFKPRRGHRALGAGFQATTNLLAMRHVSTRRQLPGSLPGIGYDYNNVWGGMLNDDRMPE